MLPRKLSGTSNIHLVHTSSPIEKDDISDFDATLKRLTAEYPNTKLFGVERRDLDPRYLAASEDERLRQFRKAIKSADAIFPIYGGTGCADIIRRLTSRDLDDLARNRPLVIGFSDTTFLINFLYFKLGLLTFHHSNMSGLYDTDANPAFFELARGERQVLELCDKRNRWLAAGAPAEPVEGIAIGGNLEVFRDLLDICEIRPPSWRQYVLFLEDIDLDSEDFHRIIIALDSRGIFKNIRALVIGRMDERDYANMSRKYDDIIGEPESHLAHLAEYLLQDVIAERKEAGDPLAILKVESLGHGVRGKRMIVPIGGKVLLKPDGCIQFTGPFVQ